MFVFGMSKFSVLNRLENAISKRRCDGAVTAKLLPSVIENPLVPGPTSTPTRQSPKRPMFDVGLANALLTNHASTVGLDTLPLPTQSGRCDAVNPRVVVPVPDGSALLKKGVRNVPDCSSVMPVKSQPPITASSVDPALPPTARPRPNGSSTMNVLTKRCRRVNATSP